MRNNITRTLSRYQSTFNSFTPGQKVVAVVGTLGLLLAGFMVFRWASTPDYAPLFSNMSSKDASAVIEKLEADGVPYELSGGGGTVMVPQDKVYATRIALSGEGLPTSSDGGYSLLDGQGISTSKFQEQTSFKRAMEGELSATIERASTASTTRSSTWPCRRSRSSPTSRTRPPRPCSSPPRAGTTLAPNQVQAIVHLVASSHRRARPGQGHRRRLHRQGALAPTTAPAAAAPAPASQQVEDFQSRDDQQDPVDARPRPRPRQLDGARSPPNLDFDKSVQESKTYTTKEGSQAALRVDPDRGVQRPRRRSGGVTGGVVGPDGSMEPTGRHGRRRLGVQEAVEDLRQRRRHRRRAPRDRPRRRREPPRRCRRSTPAAARRHQHRGRRGASSRPPPASTRSAATRSRCTTMPFDRSAEEAAAAELKAAAAAAKKRQHEQGHPQRCPRRHRRPDARPGLVQGPQAGQAAREGHDVRRRAAPHARPAARAVPVEPPAAVLALESTEQIKAEEMRAELAALVERQPEEVASLLRGWLVQS